MADREPGFVSGGSVRWYSDNVARVGYDEMTREAEGVPAGSEGLVFLPCLSGAMTPTWNGNARGVFHGLSMRHGLAHMTRAVFEGCSFGFRDVVDRFGEMGIGGEEVRGGGGADSPFWCQIKADATGRTLRALKSREATATGAAMLAGVAEGTYASLDAAAEGLVELGAIYEPNDAIGPPTTRRTGSTGRRTPRSSPSSTERRPRDDNGGRASLGRPHGSRRLARGLEHG